MAKRILLPKHMMRRGDHYFSRMVIPADLRKYFDGKHEFRQRLGPNRKVADKNHAIAIGNFSKEIEKARRKAGKSDFAVPVAPVMLLNIDSLAALHSMRQVDFDDELRNSHPQYARMEPDDRDVEVLKDAAAGRASDQLLVELIDKPFLQKYRKEGLTKVKRGDESWRAACRKLALAECLALDIIFRRFDGDAIALAGNPFQFERQAAPIAVKSSPMRRVSMPVSFKSIVELKLTEMEETGRRPDSIKKARDQLADFAKFMKHDDATRIDKKLIYSWVDYLKKRMSIRSVKQSYVSALSSALRMAVSRDMLAVNPAENLRIVVEKKIQSRSKGFTDEEAKIILDACAAYKAVRISNGNIEHQWQTAARKWVPVLCAFNGGRVGEYTQLRKEDIYPDAEIPYLRITPDAGTVKNGSYRDVPLCRELIERGFLEFVASAPDGPLFVEKSAVAKHVASGVSGWVRSLPDFPKDNEISPSHGWRHRFKSKGREAGISDRVLDAMQGHAGKTAGDDYGDVTLKAMKKAIDQIEF